MEEEDGELGSLWSEYPQLFSPVPEKCHPEPPATEEERVSALQSKIDATIDFLSSYLKRQKEMSPELKTKTPTESVASRRSVSSDVDDLSSVRPVIRRPIPPPPKPKLPLKHGYKICFEYNPGPIVRTIKFSNGTTKTYYRNGAVRTVERDGTVITVHRSTTYTAFKNGDRMQEFPDGANAYMYSSNGAVELRLPCGESIVEFKDGRREVRRPDKSVTVFLTNGKKVDVADVEELRENRYSCLQV